MKMTHNRCISNFFLGFGSILNIMPVTATTPLTKIDGQTEAAFLVRSSWQNVGNHLKQACESGKCNEY